MKTILVPRKKHARELVRLLSFGLVRGLGVQKPGKMCVEAAVCCALGLPHSDNPPCVSPIVRSFKIALNDSNWSSNEARAKGLSRLAIAQLGSNEINDTVFAKELALATVRKIVPIALRAAAKIHSNETHKVALEQNAVACEAVGDLAAASYASDASYASAASAASYAASDASYAASYAASAASYAASAASYAASYAASAKDEVLGIIAECAVQALIVCKSPGCKWLDLCER